MARWLPLAALLMLGMMGPAEATSPTSESETQFGWAKTRSQRNTDLSGGFGSPLGNLLSAVGIDSWLNPQNLKSSSSYSMSIMSGGVRAQSLGLYQHNFEYSTSGPWTVRMGIGILHNPMALMSSGQNTSLSGSVIPSFELLYRPSNKLTVSFRYQTNLGNSPFGSGTSPYSMRRMFSDGMASP